MPYCSNCGSEITPPSRTCPGCEEVTDPVETGVLESILLELFGWTDTLSIKRFLAFQSDMLACFLLNVPLALGYYAMAPKEAFLFKPATLSPHQGWQLGLDHETYNVVSMLMGESNMGVTFLNLLFSPVVWWLILITCWLYFTLFESSPLRATPGKLRQKLYVVNTLGKRISWKEANLRYWGKCLTPFCWHPLIENMADQALPGFFHDRLSGTTVKTHELPLPSPVRTPVRHGLETPQDPKRLDLNQASEFQIAMLPGVGPILAKKAILFREGHGGFDSCEQFYEVLDLKPHLAKNIAPMIGVKPLEKPEDPTPEVVADKKPLEKINLNTADRETLLSLPGFQEATVDAFIHQRELRHGFRTWPEVRTLLNASLQDFHDLKTLAVLASKSKTRRIIDC